jgi:hypothetical protein
MPTGAFATRRTDRALHFRCGFAPSAHLIAAPQAGQIIGGLTVWPGFVGCGMRQCAAVLRGQKLLLSDDLFDLLRLTAARLQAARAEMVTDVIMPNREALRPSWR